MKQNTTLKSILVFALLVVSSVTIWGQTQKVMMLQAEDGTLAPASMSSDAMIQMDTKNKGLLLPRIELQSTTAPSPLQKHIAGMYVYNTATKNDVRPGTYYNNGTKWVRGEGAINGANGITYTASSQTVSLPKGKAGQILSWNESTSQWEPRNDVDRTGAIIVGHREKISEGHIDIKRSNMDHVGVYTGMSIILPPGKYLVFARAGYMVQRVGTYSLYISVDTEKDKTGTAISNFVGGGEYQTSSTAPKAYWTVAQSSFVVDVKTKRTYYIKQVGHFNEKIVAPDFSDEYNLYAIRID